MTDDFLCTKNTYKKGHVLRHFKEQTIKKEELLCLSPLMIIDCRHTKFFALMHSICFWSFCSSQFQVPKQSENFDKKQLLQQYKVVALPYNPPIYGYQSLAPMTRPHRIASKKNRHVKLNGILIHFLLT